MKDWEKRLLAAARELEEGERETLIGFAEYLGQRGEKEERPTPEPLDIPRPEKETVVKAIRRLSATYPMLEKAKMLDETSSLMAEHTLQGREAESVIDELETIFYRHYERHVGASSGGGE
jgi:hypothetical protein